MINACVWILALACRRDITSLVWLCVWCGLDIASDEVREAIVAHGRVAPTEPE